MLDIRDAETLERIGAGVSITVVSGPFESHPTFPVDFQGPFPLVHEREGIYEVTVDKADYQQWSRGNVFVPKDRCHVRTATLTAFMVR
jgi:hypothetical protein